MVEYTKEELAFVEFLRNEGYTHVAKLPDGRWAGVQRLIFTWALCYGLDQKGNNGHYAYERLQAAMEALHTWSGVGDPPGPWIKHKGRDSTGAYTERTNPVTGDDVFEEPPHG